VGAKQPDLTGDAGGLTAPLVKTSTCRIFSSANEAAAISFSRETGIRRARASSEGH